ncbi:hypothetical protein H6F74_14140 [Trichocoleus sp. FACHB-90]|uniref:hypothetical protein n=1 Tax=Cyanophyceae TaxID=3028117 RepID=UPI001689A930|nr:hypothetical protein [Trichocoleus sp. FACHB-90]MBD1927374.1 hypothetical protein [Trichocoleus sp. FACHB-90]
MLAEEEFPALLNESMNYTGTGNPEILDIVITIGASDMMRAYRVSCHSYRYERSYIRVTASGFSSNTTTMQRQKIYKLRN